MKSSWLTGAIAFVSVLALARADDVPSDEARWGEAIVSFAGVLDGTAEAGALDRLLSDHSWVAPFARNRTESVAVLPERLAGMTVVSARGALQPAITSASDLVADLESDAGIPEAIKRRVVPPAGRDLRQADATMARWFALALEAQAGDPVALVALVDPGRPTAGGPAVPSLVLLLIRGEFAEKGPRISRVLYGTLDAAVR